MPNRKNISDYINSQLMTEVCNCCPMCGVFENTGKGFTNHHINHDPSTSEYWNLIRICQKCHNEINEIQDGHRDRRIKQIKKDLFRKLIGPASYEVLLLAEQYGITSTLPCLAVSLIKLELVSIVQENSITVGAANHPTIGDYELTGVGKELIVRLNLK